MLSHGVGRGGLASSLSLLQGLGPEVLLLGQLGVLLDHSSVRVELQHAPDVLQRVGPDHSPDGLGLEQSGKVGVGHLGLRKVPASLRGGCLPPGAVESIKLLECRLGPDAEPADMASRGELQQVQVVHLDDINTGNVPESLGDALVLVVDDKGTQLLDVAAVPQLALAGTHAAGGVDLSNISPSLVPPEELNGLLSAGEALHGVGDDQGNLRNSINDVTLGHHEGGHSGGGNGRAHGVPLLGNADLPVPPPPLLGGSEHASTPAHVAEGSLSRPVGSATPHSGDPSNSTAGTPGLSRCLMSSRLRHTVGLALVLSNVVVHQGDNVGPDGSPKDRRQTVVPVGAFLSLCTPIRGRAAARDILASSLVE